MTFCRFPSSQRYGVYVEDVSQWYKTNRNTGETIVPDWQEVRVVLDSVKLAFDDCFSRDYVESFHASILPTVDDPCAFRDQSIIFISAKGRSWTDYIYEFSHELCHLMIPKSPTKRLRWFEESICHMASFFFLRLFSVQWRSMPPYQTQEWRDYADTLSAYCNEKMSLISSLGPSQSFGDFIAEKLPELEENPEIRDIDRLCAVHLLPLFEENHLLWRDVPKLCLIPGDLSFAESLVEWRAISTQKDTISKIAALFYFNPTGPGG